MCQHLKRGEASEVVLGTTDKNVQKVRDGLRHGGHDRHGSQYNNNKKKRWAYKIKQYLNLYFSSANSSGQAGRTQKSITDNI